MLSGSARAVSSFDFPKILSQPERYSGVETLEKWLVDVCDADLGASVLFGLSPEMPVVSFDFCSALVVEASCEAVDGFEFSFFAITGLDPAFPLVVFLFIKNLHLNVYDLLYPSAKL